MYEKHKNLLRKICHQFTNYEIEFEDLMSIGNEIYVLALKEFEENRKIKFTTMLYPYVKNAIINEIKKNLRQQNEICVKDINCFSNSFDIEKKVIFVEQIKSLSKEAQEVTQIIFSSPSDVLKNAGIFCPKKIRGHIYKKLRKRNWPERKIWKIFSEIKEALK